MKKQIAFIINPKSGIINKQKIPGLIEKELDKQRFQPEIVFTKYAGHATKLALEFVEKGFEYIVAVGGDGTVNEIAMVLRHNSAALGIIPIGSGNGLARHLGISMNVKKAIRQLNNSKISTIDYCSLNNKPFFCTCGVGFDAYISQEFDRVKKRGVFAYLKKIFKGFFKYKPHHYTVVCDEKEIKTQAFLITVANASQWGNNAHIAPTASLKDGKLNITIIKEIPFRRALRQAIKLYTKTIDNNRYIRTLTGQEIIITEEGNMPFHLDGEPLGEAPQVHVSVVHQGLRVFCSQDFQ